MKNYRIKNYKGNLVESLTKFAKSHKGMRIVEAVEDEDELKVKAEVDEAAGKKIYLVLADLEDEAADMLIGIASSRANAKQMIEGVSDDPSELRIEEIELDNPTSKSISIEIS